MSIEDIIIEVYCMVDEISQEMDQKYRTREYVPKLTDSEMITMEIVAEFLGIDTDKVAWEYFRQHWLCWFPHLGSRSNFAKHALNVWHQTQKRLSQ